MTKVIQKTLDFFTSLRLTVGLLVLAMVLVFIGTLAQVKHGLYIVQHEYFQSAFVWWKPEGSKFKIPVWPGGYLLGWLLLINLVAAHIKRFEINKKKLGIFIIHFGLILLLIGQFLTEMFQVESYMTLPEGTAKNYSESGRISELAIIDVSDPKEDRVYAIPQDLLAKEGEVADEQLPFKVKVHYFYENTDVRLKPAGSPTAGASHELEFVKIPFATAMDQRNLPATTVSIETDEGTKGPFTVASWLAEERLVRSINEQLGSRIAKDFHAPPTFSYKGREFQLFLRQARYYKPYSIHLIDFTHERYPGTEIPKNFSSRVQVVNPEKNENREVLIYMNNPLRYGGETYYQGSFEPGDTVSILQVVRNPSWLTPYVACTLVGLGLTVQFLSHLFSFARKKRST